MKNSLGFACLRISKTRLVRRKTRLSTEAVRDTGERLVLRSHEEVGGSSTSRAELARVEHVGRDVGESGSAE
jgi:hypothetical protein